MGVKRIIHRARASRARRSRSASCVACRRLGQSARASASGMPARTPCEKATLQSAVNSSREATVWMRTRGIGSESEISDFRFETSPCRANWRRRQSIGQLRSRTQRICLALDLEFVVTAALQEDGCSDLPSVAVNELHFPSLHCTFPRVGGDEPSRGGGVVSGGRAEVAHDQPDAASFFGGELKAARFDARKPRRGGGACACVTGAGAT